MKTKYKKIYTDTKTTLIPTIIVATTLGTICEREGKHKCFLFTQILDFGNSLLAQLEEEQRKRDVGLFVHKFYNSINIPHL